MTTSTRIQDRIQAFVVEKGMTVAFAVTDCPTCGVIYALTQSFRDERYSDGRTFYCPNGHTLSWHKTEADRLREQLSRKEQEINGALDRLNAEKSAHAETERERRRIVKRVEAGVCIECNRTFQNLARHMATSHDKGPHADPNEHLTAMLVHKRHGYGWSARKDGSLYVKCGANRIPAVRAVHRWSDVTCEKCRERAAEWPAEGSHP